MFEILCKLLYTHPLLGVHVVNGEELQLVVAICDEGSGLILGEWHSQGYDHMLVVFVLLLLEETTFTLKSVFVEVFLQFYMEMHHNVK